MPKHELQALDNLGRHSEFIMRHGKCACGQPFNGACGICKQVLCKDHCDDECPGTQQEATFKQVAAAIDTAYRLGLRNGRQDELKRLAVFLQKSNDPLGVDPTDLDDYIEERSLAATKG